MSALVAVVTGSPLSAETLLLIAGLVVLVLVVLWFLGEIAQIRDELESLRRANHRRGVLRILDGRRWR